MMRRYARRNYRRIGRAALGMAVRRYRRTYTRRTRYLRGTAAGRIKSSTAKSKRSWARAMGTALVPSARSKYSKTQYHGQLGLRPGTNGSKRFKHEERNVELNDKTLHKYPCIEVLWSDDDTVMNRRAGRLAVVKGVKLRVWWTLKNLSEASVKFDDPIQVRWAILNPKDQPLGTQSDVKDTNFFISDSPSNDDATDFPPQGTCFRYMNRKINKRRYGVMQEGTFVIQNDVGSNNTRMDMRGKKFLSLWLPINRQMKWAINTTEPSGRFPNTNIYFCWWYCAMGDNTEASKYVGVNNVPIECLHERITYFKDADPLR